MKTCSKKAMFYSLNVRFDSKVIIFWSTSKTLTLTDIVEYFYISEYKVENLSISFDSSVSYLKL